MHCAGTSFRTPEPAATLASLAAEKQNLANQKEGLAKTSELQQKVARQLYNDANRRQRDKTAQLAITEERHQLAITRAREGAEFLRDGLISETQLNQRLDAESVLAQSVLQLTGEIGDAEALQQKSLIEMDQYAAEYERAASDLRVRINRIEAQNNQIESEAR